MLALGMPDHHHASPLETGKPSDDRGVIGKGAVACQRQELVEQTGDKVRQMRPVGMPRDLRALPRRQARIEIGQLTVRPFFQHRGTRFMPTRFAELGGTLPKRLDLFFEG